MTKPTTIELKKLKLLAREAKRKARARGNLSDFIQYTYSDYDAQWFHLKICEYLDKLHKGEIKKLMIFVPPQHGKSEISSRRFPAYVLGKNPNEKIAVCSYSATLASSFNRSMQMIIDDKAYNELFPNTTLNASRVSNGTTSGYLRNTEMFEIVGAKGFVKTVGVGGSLTGTPVDLGIIDDPFKDRIEANSETYRNRVWGWYQDVFLTRLHNDSKQLMLFTRWHEDDLAGRILDPKNKHYNAEEAKEWTVIALPALKEAEPPIKCALDIGDPRKIDEALWESKHSAKKYYKRRIINPTGFNSLDQQRPSALGGNKLKADYFVIKKESELPFNLQSVKADFIVDGAYTESTKNDETGLLSCYFNRSEKKLYILNAHGIRKELAEFLDYFKPYTRLNGWKPESTVRIEPKASGKDMKSMLRKVQYGGFNVAEIPNDAVALGKWNRAELAEPFLISGRVVLVEGGWNSAFLTQLGEFPNGSHDDLVDCLTYAIWYYFIREYGADGGLEYEN